MAGVNPQYKDTTMQAVKKSSDAHSSNRKTCWERFTQKYTQMTKTQQDIILKVMHSTEFLPINADIGQ